MTSSFKGEFMDTIAIGDVHGRADLLEHLLIHIHANHPETRIVFLGDIIDRGPDSRQCLDMVASELKRNPDSKLIMGNHEDLMLRFLDGGSTLSRGWCWNGGLSTVTSYGYAGYDFCGDDNFMYLRDELADRFKSEYPSHVAIMGEAVPYVDLPEYVLVHAGIVPGVAMDQQDPYKLRWDSKSLIAHKDRLRKVVVHGHTITASRMPEIHVNRINVDCGAYESGILCATLLSAEASPAFILSQRQGRQYKVQDTSQECGLVWPEF